MSLPVNELMGIVEGVLFAAGRPMTLEQIQKVFVTEEEDAPPRKEDLEKILGMIEHDYRARTVNLKQTASGYQFQVGQSVAPWVARLWDEKPAKYTRATLETLAIIAYRQPVTRGEIEDIRGVSVSSNTIKSMQERDWIRVVGHRDVPGKPALYATTKQFLDYFDLQSLEDLPTLAELEAKQQAALEAAEAAEAARMADEAQARSDALSVAPQPLAPESDRELEEDTHHAESTETPEQARLEHAPDFEAIASAGEQAPCDEAAADDPELSAEDDAAESGCNEVQAHSGHEADQAEFSATSLKADATCDAVSEAEETV